MNLLSRKKINKEPDFEVYNKLATKIKSKEKPSFQTTAKINSVMSYNYNDYLSGRYRIKLYRFLMDNIPVVNSCISTWVRLSAAPGGYRIIDSNGENSAEKAQMLLNKLSEKIYVSSSGNSGSLVTFLAELFSAMYRDGLFAGFLTVKKDGNGVDKFIPIDTVNLIHQKDKNHIRLLLETDTGTIDLYRNDFYYIPLNSDVSKPLGSSILQAVPFVTYIEQQLVDDMRRTSHNSGYHRLHVRVTPPERMGGESDNAYVERINSYFDSTVSMIKTCEVDENPVTWDNVNIEHIGPQNIRTVTNSWFMNHRAMVEEICAGTNLAPFLLGYSYGATTTWASFKFDIVMRQVKSVQAEVASFLEWIGNIELALAGLKHKCHFEFENTFAYQATEKATVQSKQVENILKLYQAGLLDEKTAREKAGGLI